MGRRNKKHTRYAIVVGSIGLFAIAAPFLFETLWSWGPALLFGGFALLVVAAVLGSKSSPSGNDSFARRGGG